MSRNWGSSYSTLDDSHHTAKPPSDISWAVSWPVPSRYSRLLGSREDWIREFIEARWVSRLFPCHPSSLNKFVWKDDLSFSQVKLYEKSRQFVYVRALLTYLSSLGPRGLLRPERRLRHPSRSAAKATAASHHGLPTQLIPFFLHSSSPRFPRPTSLPLTFGCRR